MFASRVLEVEQGFFIPLVFITNRGMADEWKRYHSRLAKLLSTKKGEDYSNTMSWIRPPPHVVRAEYYRLLTTLKLIS